MHKHLMILALTAAFGCGGMVTGDEPDKPVPTLNLPDYENPGTLTVAIDQSTPGPTNYVMGAIGVKVATYTICVTGTPEAGGRLEKVISSLRYNGMQPPIFRNARYIDENGAPIGATAANFEQYVNGQEIAAGYSHAINPNLNLFVPNNSCRYISQLVDIADYNEGFTTTGQQATPAILAPLENFTPITAVNVKTAQTLKVVVKDNKTGSPALGAHAATATTYRAKIGVEWASDSPKGPSSPSATQTIVKVVVTNVLNNGNYTTPVSSLKLALKSSIENVNNDRLLACYSNGSLIGSHLYRKGDPINGNLNLPIASTISSGQSKTITCTFDTTDFGTGGAQSLEVSVPNNGISWSDGVLAGLTASGQTLPLRPIVYSYGG